MMVSGKGFDVDAINFAREYHFECFVRTEKGFKQVL